jgi:peptidyl-tRNA hydrolase, PTH1 family
MLVAGLGNPGERYAGTRHNIGFLVVDELAGRLSGKWRRSLRFHAWMSEGTLGGMRALLVKPLTYMNESGDAVGRILRYRGAEPDRLAVVLDDADLPLGRLRIRARGSSGGHRGLLSIIQAVGSEDFVRIRVGIGRETDGRGLVDYVLASFSPEEREIVDGAIERAAEAVVCVMESGVEAAMNAFNGAVPAPSEA